MSSKLAVSPDTEVHIHVPLQYNKTICMLQQTRQLANQVNIRSMQWKSYDNIQHTSALSQ